MNSTEVASTNLTLGGKKLAWARAGLLALAVLTPLFLAANIWSDWVIFSNYFAEGHQILGTFYGIIDLIDTTTIVFSWVLALILLRKKLNDVGQILVTLMFLTRVTSHTFWYLLFMGTTPEVEPGLRTFLVLAMTIPYEFLNVLSLFAVLLTFPTGRFYNRFARWLFWLASAIQVLSLVLSLPIQNGITAYGALDTSSFSLYMGLAIGYMPILIQMLAGFMLFLHYRAMPNSGQRQQIKWIVVFFVLSSCVIAFNAIMPFILNPILVWLSTQNLMPWTLETLILIQGSFDTLPTTIINLAIVIAFGIAIFSYRLWDVDIFINRALVYASLTAVLGGLTILSITLVDFIIKQWIGDESSIWGVLVSLLPAAGAFNPLRDRLQAWVDQRFKPEEVDFSATFIEFNPPVRERLSPETILQTVAHQVAKQLELDHARIYLEQSNGQISPALPETPAPPLLDENQLSTLRAGELVVPESGAEYSLLVPLLVPRARFPDFLGVIVLGQRLNGKGYSTPILENLKTLGSDAGTAIYLSTITAQKANDAAQAG